MFTTYVICEISDGRWGGAPGLENGGIVMFLCWRSPKLSPLSIISLWRWRGCPRLFHSSVWPLQSYWCWCSTHLENTDTEWSLSSREACISFCICNIIWLLKFSSTRSNKEMYHQVLKGTYCGKKQNKTYFMPERICLGDLRNHKLYWQKQRKKRAIYLLSIPNFKSLYIFCTSEDECSSELSNAFKK